MSFRARSSPILCLIAALTAYAGLWLLAPKATFYPFITEVMSLAVSLTHGLPSAVLTAISVGIFFAPTMAFMAVQFATVYFFARLKTDFWRSLLALGVFVTVAVGLAVVIGARSGLIEKLHRLPLISRYLTAVAIDRSVLKIPMVMAVMLTAAGIGVLVSLRVTDKNLLLPVVLFAACMDVWTVVQGPVSVMMKKAPEVVNAVSVPIPQAGAGVFIPKFLIGPGDFLFSGLVFAVVARFKMNGPRTFWFVLGTMMLGMLGISAGVLNQFPALILLGIGVVAANWREFKLSRSELISVAVVAAMLAVITPLVWSVLRHGGK
jgi:hypothetical protein